MELKNESSVDLSEDSVSTTEHEQTQPQLVKIPARAATPKTGDNKREQKKGRKEQDQVAKAVKAPETRGRPRKSVLMKYDKYMAFPAKNSEQGQDAKTKASNHKSALKNRVVYSAVHHYDIEVIEIEVDGKQKLVLDPVYKK